jgi:hypothetical protein
LYSFPSSIAVQILGLFISITFMVFGAFNALILRDVAKHKSP